MQHLKTPNLRVIACGGDGTIRWVIQGLINAGFKHLPPVRPDFLERAECLSLVCCQLELAMIYHGCLGGVLATREKTCRVS